ncbi:MAG: hypothetical protein AB7F23_04490 [Phycisphaerae bacterium]
MRRKILRLYNFGALARLRCFSPADAGEFKPQTAPLRKQCDTAGATERSDGKNATGLTFNFGALARLRCFSPTDAGEFKPQTAQLRKQCDTAGATERSDGKNATGLTFNFGALARLRCARAGFVLN